MSVIYGEYFANVHFGDIPMGVDPWMDRGTCPPTFWSGENALCFVLPPYVQGL